MTNELVAQEKMNTSIAGSMSPNELLQQVEMIQNLMKTVMKDGEHYGTVPGCGNKKVLLKAGAEKLAFVFRLAPEFEGESPIDLGNGHREYIIKTTLRDRLTGQVVGTGVGSCSTMEKKYRYRSGPSENTGKLVPKEYWNLRKSDPHKAQESIGGKGFVTKKEDGGWFIFQQGESVENDCVADVYNTVLKMAKKRSVVDATITATAASDIFTQDLDENQPETTDTKSVKTETRAPIGMPTEQQPAGAQQATVTAPSGPVISEAQAKRFYAIAKGAKKSDEEIKSFLDFYGFKSSKEITKKVYEEVCTNVVKNIAPAQPAEPGTDPEEPLPGSLPLE